MIVDMEVDAAILLSRDAEKPMLFEKYSDMVIVLSLLSSSGQLVNGLA
jgi:hypothetical protein